MKSGEQQICTGGGSSADCRSGTLYITQYIVCTSQQNAGDILEYQISQISQRPDAPQGSTSPLPETGSPTSWEST